MPGNGRRALTHSERKWLVEQMASQRRRPASADRPVDDEASDPAERSTPAPSATELTPPARPAQPTRDIAPRTTTGESTTRRRPPRAPQGPPGTQDSFWSFG